MRHLILGAAIAAFGLAGSAHAAIIADFNTNMTPFTAYPTIQSGANVGQPTSGSTNGMSGASNIALDTSTKAEGLSSQLIQFNATGGSARLRHTAGGGTPANNTPFATTAGTDGWIGVYVKTTSPGWNLQIYMEPAATGGATGSNGSIPKNINNDGQWHLYEWNLDDNSGGANGWGTIAGIVTGVATVGNGNHTLDSLIFRNTNATAGTTDIYIDFVAINPNGSVADILPEPASLSLLAFGALPLLRRRRA